MMDQDKRDNVIKLAGSLAKENVSKLKQARREKRKKWLPLLLIAVVACVCITGWFVYNSPQVTTEAPSIFETESEPLPADEEILKYFNAVAVKRLAVSEIDPTVSNKHEFHGIKSFQNMFGPDKQRFRARFVYFGKGKNFSSDTEVTWYGFPVGKEKEKMMYQLYYRENPVTREAKAGDSLFVAKYSDEQVMAIVAQEGSAAEAQLFQIFAIEPDIPRSGLNIKPDDTEISVKNVLYDQLQQTGKVPIKVDIWKDVETGEISISGRVDKVKDGDTINLSEIFDVRLLGIDTPEKKQICKVDGKDWECGRAAREYLESLVLGKEVHCTNKKKEKYGRFLSICEAGGININEAMVKKGLAVIYYSDIYADLEKEARLNEVGLWGSEFITPKEWRKGVRY